MFDVKKFKNSKLKQRVAEIPVPALSDFFPEGEKAIWKVRGLTGQEIGAARESVSKNKNMAAMIDALSATSHSEKIKGIKEALGFGKVSDDVAQRVAQLEAGSIEPACDTELAIKLCEHFPVEFYEITNKILALTGKGSELGKQKGSTQSPELEPV